MPLTVTRLDKPFRVKFGASGLLVRPLSPAYETALKAAHTVSGVLNQAAYMVALVEAVIVGWDGVVDQEGEAVPFDQKLLWHVRLDGLEPDEVLGRVLRCLCGADDPLADRSGTSSPTASGGSVVETQQRSNDLSRIGAE